jgi:hypothetical protein
MDPLSGIEQKVLEVNKNAMVIHRVGLLLMEWEWGWEKHELIVTKLVLASSLECEAGQRRRSHYIEAGKLRQAR